MTVGLFNISIPDLGGRPLCAESNPDAWFPEKGERTADAKAVCQRCPVIVRCLEWAMANNERFGVWGGLSEQERERLRRGRAA